MSFLPDPLVQVVQALVSDADLALWFESLAEVPVTARAAEFRAMAARMKAAGTDEELIHAVGLLAIHGAYDGVLAAFRELRAEL